jgi:hypothetical protein
MGNSGAALSDPTAPSYYNPSLLSNKKKDSYSLSGNTFGSIYSKSDNSELTSLTLNPGYLSTILVGEGLVHEIFIINTSPSKLKIVENRDSPDSITRIEKTRDQTQFLFGYSMAFRSVPFALSYFGQFTQVNTVGFTEQTSLTNNQRSTTYTKGDLRALGTGLSVSGHTTLKNYSFGYSLRTRQLSLYKKDEETSSRFVHGGTSPTDYERIDSSYENSNPESISNGASLILGHDFQIGDHEFTTDSQFQETSELSNKFKLNQTFGYRMNSNFGHQILCGISHELGPQVKYFGQSVYYSVGYSWLKNSLRTVLGSYLYTSKISQDVFAVGLTFGSEFSY